MAQGRAPFKAKETRASATDFTDESTEKTLSTTKGTKYTKEFLSVFSKILNFHASHL